MSVVKLLALESLRAAVEAFVPALEPMQGKGGGMVSRIKIVQTPPDVKAPLPSLAIVPGRFRFEGTQEREQAEITPEVTAICCGRWLAPVQLRVAAATQAEQYKLEQDISDLFMQRENAAGSLITRVAQSERGAFTAAWELVDDEWSAEAAFSTLFWDVLTIEATIPVLVRRPGVYTIEQLRVGLTQDFDMAFTADAFITQPGLAVFQVNGDGSISRV